MLGVDLPVTMAESVMLQSATDLQVETAATETPAATEEPPATTEETPATTEETPATTEETPAATEETPATTEETLATTEETPAEPEVPAAPATVRVRFVCKPGDTAVRVVSVRLLKEGFQPTDAELTALLDAMPAGETVLLDADGEALLETTDYPCGAAGLDLLPGTYYLSASRKGCQASGFHAFTLPDEGMAELSIEVTLTKLPEAPAPDAAEAPVEQPVEAPAAEVQTPTDLAPQTATDLTPAAETVTVTLAGLPAGAQVVVASAAGALMTPAEDGSYALPAGDYCWTASCEGYATRENVPFQVVDAEEAQEVLVWLLSKERAAVSRSANTVLFAVKGEGSGQAAISAELQALLDGLSVTRADYFFTDKGENGYRSVYYGTMDNDDVWFAIDMLLRSPEVDYAEPDYLYHSTDEGGIVDEVPPDEGETGLQNPWYKDQRFLENAPYYETLNATTVWGTLEQDGKRPGEGVIVAVIDTGVDYTHPDLADNMWVNTAELNGAPGVDDDGNGYVDDVYSYNFVSNNGNVRDDNGHGTHVAGVIAMADNGVGGVGLAYGAKVMAIKAGQATGTFSASDIARAVLYAKANGASVINMSFGSYYNSSIVESALKQAFGSCVLVAAAGNDGIHTTDLPNGADMFPAAYTYVLGVMAVSDEETGLAGFSNWDCIIGTKVEYELAAPGMSIYSTLPGGRYARWSGTSMAAPLVSAAAAILRAEKGGSSRYIMGQLVGASQLHAGSYPALDLVSALNLQPKPDISVTGVELFDTASFSDTNNGDGVWQNGETIELGLEVTNRWSAATNVTVTADSLSDMGVETGLVDWGDNTAAIDTIGSYATANSGYIYEEDKLTGVSDPLRFVIHEDVANGVEIPINLHVTATNEMDPDDPKVYTADYAFVLTVENGAVICGILTEDTTLTSDRLWIIRGSLEVPEGITLTVEAGTHIFFERVFAGVSTIDENYYPYIDVLGTANFNGTADDPIYLTTDTRLKIYECGGKYNSLNYLDLGTWIDIAPNCTLTYVDIYGGPEEEIVHGSTTMPCVLAGNIYHCTMRNVGIQGFNVESSVFTNCATPFSGSNVSYYSTYQNSLFDKCFVPDSNGPKKTTLDDCVLINMLGVYYSGPLLGGASKAQSCAILNPLNRPNEWLRPNSMNAGYSMANCFWGTNSESVIQDILLDSNDITTYGTIAYAPFLTKDSDMSGIYPFVVDAWVEDMDGQRIDTIAGAQDVSFHVLFNRDMNQSIQPTVGYGPDTPYNDITLKGGWVSAREWVAESYVNPIIEFGTMYFSIGGAVAASDSWLRTATDTRLWFTIAGSSAEALTLQSFADAQGIHLSWTQDDFDTLAGYNLYRSDALNEDGTLSSPTRINETLLPYEEMAFVDANVQEGQTYYYMFTVMQTDFTESKGSNISTCTALDMTAPVLVHTPVESVMKDESINVSADITDNVQMVSATLAPGAATEVEYYIAAYDGTGYGYSGTAEAPHTVQVLTRDIVKGDADLNGEVDILDLTLTAQTIAGLRSLSGLAFTSADVNGDGAIDIFDLMRIAQFICGMIDTL